MTIIQVPKTLGDAKTALAGIDQLLTAKGWERAAVVYAFTESNPGRRTDLAQKGARLTFRDFAKLNIKGLTKRDVVAEYHRIWANAIEDGHAQPCQPGEKITLPTIDWPGRQDSEGQKRYTAQDPSSFARHINALPPDRREVFVEAMTQDLDPAAVSVVVGRIAEDQPDIVIAHAGSAFHNQVQQRGPKLTWPSPGGYQRTARDDCDASIALIVRELRALRSQKQQLSQAERAEAADALREIGKTSDTLATYFETDAASIEAELAKLLKEEA
jgi:hypothetical protein